MIQKLLRVIYKALNNDSVKNPEYEKMKVAEQKKFVSSLSEPKDDYERSYNKYRCFCEYCYYKRKWRLIIYNIGAFFVYPFIFWKMSRKGSNVSKADCKVDAVIENVPRLPNSDVIPDGLLERFKTIKEITSVNYKNIFLNSTAKEICKELTKRYPLSPYFRIIVLFKLALFSKYIEENNPNAIVFYSCEREFSGPLQTFLCEKEGVEYISYMHGEYLYNMSFAFQRFSHYYIWDEAYRKMFLDLRSASDMSIYFPKKLCKEKTNKKDCECKYFATYYFSAETKESIAIISDILRSFQEKGLRCKVRAHPRFSQYETIKKLLFDIDIENNADYSVEESIEDSVYAIGLNTTVLSEAFFKGKKVVIDDISMTEEYVELKEKGYIMLSREHILLSQLIQGINENFIYNEEFEFYNKH